MGQARRSILPVVVLLTIAGASRVQAQDTPTPSWPEVKCARYSRDWTEALARRGPKGLGPDFLDRHAAFIASGCLTQGSVCPRSPEELDLANLMTIRAMNSGTASTFLPFGCRL